MKFTEEQVSVTAERMGCSREEAKDALQYAFGSWNFYSVLKGWLDKQRFLLLESVCGKYRKKVGSLSLMSLLRLQDEHWLHHHTNFNPLIRYCTVDWSNNISIF